MISDECQRFADKEKGKGLLQRDLKVTQRSKVRTFEDLITWQEAIALARDVYALTRNGPFSKDFGLKDQI